jgi:Holliday junction resolvase RusA-like endonuclease
MISYSTRPLVPIWEHVYQGHMPRKSNSRRIVRNKHTGAPLVIKSAEALSWVNDVILESREHAIGYDSPVVMTADIYYRSNRSDLSEELLMDALEKAGILTNDRLIVGKIALKHIDKDNPRVEVRLYRPEDLFPDYSPPCAKRRKP